MNDIKQFVENYLLKSQEQMEWIDKENDFLLGYIIRRTPRTYRRLARLSVTAYISSAPTKPDSELLKQRMSINKAKYLPFDSKTIRQWLLDGYIVRKIELSNDGRTPLSEAYLMGPALYEFIEQERKTKLDQQITHFKKNQIKLKDCSIPEETPFLNSKVNYLRSISYQTFESDDVFHDWTISKRMRFLEFLVALLRLRAKKNTFDFKEIGASYFQTIGGSKRFDSYREDFISLLEDWLNDSIQTLGLISQGHITSIYFSGCATSEFSKYEVGALHAVTDLAVLQSNFKTTNKVLWLVENRAMLTRMAASTEFMKNTHSFVICLDGHVRSAHRLFIQQISNCSDLEQVLIWTDYDNAGLTIAEEAYLAIPQQLTVKWIARNGEVFFDLEEYSHWLQRQLKSTKREQEEVLGDEKDWKKWINS